MKHFRKVVTSLRPGNPARSRTALLDEPPHLPRSDTLRKFRVEEGNELAFRAAREVSQRPGTAYNPTLFYGPSGAGKTHLLKAVAYHVDRHRGRVVWTSGRTFAACFRRCQAESRLEDLRLRFIDSDLWILDGYDSLCGKPATEREASQMFDVLKDKGAQIVLAGREHPNRLYTTCATFKTRLLSGFDVAIAPLSPEGMAGVLARRWPGRKQASSATFLPLVRRLGGDLKAALKLLPALHASLRGAKLSAASLRRVLGGELGRNLRSVGFADVLATVCDRLEVETEALSGRSRRAVHSRARRVFFYLCWRLGLGQQREIARQLQRSPSYVSNSLKKLKGEMLEDAELASLVRGLENQLRRPSR